MKGREPQKAAAHALSFINVFRPSWARERSECAKQKTTCFAGGGIKII